MTDSSFIYTPSIHDPTGRDVQHFSELFDIDPAFPHDFPTVEPTPVASREHIRHPVTEAALDDHQPPLSTRTISQEASNMPSSAPMWRSVDPEAADDVPFSSYMPDNNPWVDNFPFRQFDDTRSLDLEDPRFLDLDHLFPPRPRTSLAWSRYESDPLFEDHPGNFNTDEYFDSDLVYGREQRSHRPPDDLVYRPLLDDGPDWHRRILETSPSFSHLPSESRGLTVNIDPHGEWMHHTDSQSYPLSSDIATPLSAASTHSSMDTNSWQPPSTMHQGHETYDTPHETAHVQPISFRGTTENLTEKSVDFSILSLPGLLSGPVAAPSAISPAPAATRKRKREEFVELPQALGAGSNAPSRSSSCASPFLGKPQRNTPQQVFRRPIRRESTEPSTCLPESSTPQIRPTASASSLPSQGFKKEMPEQTYSDSDSSVGCFTDHQSSEDSPNHGGALLNESNREDSTDSESSSESLAGRLFTTFTVDGKRKYRCRYISPLRPRSGACGSLLDGPYGRNWTRHLSTVHGREEQAAIKRGDLTHEQAIALNDPACQKQEHTCAQDDCRWFVQKGERWHVAKWGRIDRDRERHCEEWHEETQQPQRGRKASGKKLKASSSNAKSPNSKSKAAYLQGTTEKTLEPLSAKPS